MSILIHRSMPLLLAFLLTACVTPRDRAERHPEVFDALSSQQQESVLRGEIEQGMPEGAVIIAMGEPSYRKEGEFEGRPVTGWVYSRVETERVPHYRISTFVDAQGNVVATEVYDPILRQQWVPARVVFIREGQVVGWQEL